MNQAKGGRPGSRDAPGPTIDARGFRALVASYMRRMETDEEMSLSDYIAMIRLWNTVEKLHLREGDPIFDRYASAFFPQHIERAARLLGAQPTKGMALYSKQHDIYLGGPRHAHSEYRIED
jgi:hypothetical protein